MTPTKTHLAFAKNALISLGFYTFFVGGGEAVFTRLITRIIIYLAIFR